MTCCYAWFFVGRRPAPAFRHDLMEKPCLFEYGNYISKKNKKFSVRFQHKNTPKYADGDQGISEQGGAV